MGKKDCATHVCGYSNESVYNVVLGRTFLVKLDIMIYTFLLNLNHHNNFGEPFVISIDLRGDFLIHEILQEKEEDSYNQS